MLTTLVAPASYCEPGFNETTANLCCTRTSRHNTWILLLSFSVLQKHYHVLEALALEHEEEEEMTDFTVPDVDRIDQRAGSAIEEFKQMVFPPGYDPEGKGTGSKRKVTMAPHCINCPYISDVL